MALHLTPEMLEAAYELLRATPPFRGWRLPAGDDVEFHVTRHVDIHGDCVDAGHAHVIRISERKHSTIQALLVTMAHEMCHMRQDIKAPHEGEHGKIFKQLAQRVCRYHGFDLKAF